MYSDTSRLLPRRRTGPSRWFGQRLANRFFPSRDAKWRGIHRRQHTLFVEPIDDPQADDGQPVPDGVAAQTMRAILLASATATSILGLRASIPASQGSVVTPRRTAHRTTVIAPVIKSRLKSRWPIFDPPHRLRSTDGGRNTGVPSGGGQSRRARGCGEDPPGRGGAPGRQRTGGRGDLLADHRFGRPRRAPDNARLAGLDQEGEDRTA